MRIELGAPVVAELRGEALVLERLHLATDAKTWGTGRGRWHERRLHEYAWPPLEWPTLCGLSGYLYVYDGVIRRHGFRFCAVCLERCNRELDGVAVSWDPPARLRIAA
jgi:hypothetical protein